MMNIKSKPGGRFDKQDVPLVPRVRLSTAIFLPNPHRTQRNKRIFALILNAVPQVIAALLLSDLSL
jgi:hypothetical protein